MPWGPTAGWALEELADWQLVWGDERAAERGLWVAVNHHQMVIHGHYHHRYVEFGTGRINLAIESGGAVLVVEGHRVCASDGKVIEIDRERLRV